MLKTVSSIVNAIGALNYKGTWNADTNTPTLASGVGVQGDYYVVSVSGSTDLDGTTNWGVGDWAAFNGSIWQRLEGGADGNFVNLSVSGTATMGDLTVNGDVVVNDTRPQLQLMESDTTDVNSVIKTTAGQFRIQTINDAASSTTNRLIIDHATGDISFYNSAGSSRSLFWDAAAESLGINDTAPGRRLSVNSAGVQIAAKFESTSTTSARIGLVDANTTADNYVNVAAAGNDMALYAGAAERMRIDSSGNVGISTSSPGRLLELKESSTGAGDAIIRLRGNGNNANNTPLGSLEWFNADSSGAQPGVVAAVEAQSANANGHMGKLLLKTHDGSGSEADPPTTRMIIDESGLVGIGTDSPDDILHLSSTLGTTLRIESTATSTVAGNNIGKIEFEGQDTEGAGVTAAIRAEVLGSLGQTGLAFDTGSGGASAQRMLLDQNGNLLVGKTATGAANAGIELNGANDLLRIARDGGVLQELNRIGTGGTENGDLIEFRVNNTAVGIIGTRANYLKIGHGDTGLLFNSGTDAIYGESTTGGARDASIDLGVAGVRFKDLYLSGGVYLGGTAADNLLDDYEEGTWTATLSDAESGGNDSSTTVTGHYTKIGRIVHARIFNLNDIDTTGMTGSNDLRVSLPIAASSGLNVGSVVMDGIDLGSGFTQVQVRTQSSSSKALFIKTGSNQSDNFVNVSAITSGTDDISALSITYETA